MKIPYSLTDILVGGEARLGQGIFHTTTSTPATLHLHPHPCCPQQQPPPPTLYKPCPSYLVCLLPPHAPDLYPLYHHHTGQEAEGGRILYYLSSCISPLLLCARTPHCSISFLFIHLSPPIPYSDVSVREANSCRKCVCEKACRQWPETCV